MAINGIDPSAKTPSRIRRNWNRTSVGAVTSTLLTTQPITISSANKITLNVASNGGIDTAVGALKLKLDTNPGLVTSTGGLKVLLDSTPGLVLGSGGIKVLLGSSPGLSLTSGLVVLLDSSPGLVLGSGGLKVLLGSTPGLTLTGGLAVSLDATNPCLQLTSGLAVTVHSAGALTKTSTGLQVAVDGSTIEISSNSIRLKDGGITGVKLATGLTLPPFKVSESANMPMGTATLVAGTKTISNTLVGANTRIFLSVVTPGGVAGFLDAGTRVNGTSFTITSSSVADTSTVAFLLIEPA